MRWVAILFLAICTAAVGQDTSSGSTPKKSGTKAGAVPDAQFATKAAQGNMAEVALGKLATEKSQNDDVKKFGQMMVDDHSKAEQDLEGVASKNNWTLPKEVNAQQKAEQQRLEKLSGAAFDRAYVQMMVKDHVKDVAEFKKEAADTSANPDLKDFVTRTYPTLDNHLTHAKALQDSMNKSGASSKAAGKSKKKNTAAATSGGAGLLLI
jgi:putative membrane protein